MMIGNKKFSVKIAMIRCIVLRLRESLVVDLDIFGEKGL